VNTLYWHDYETWGAKPSVDKPSQFAGVRTDEDLNIIGEPLVIFCRPNHDCLPQPQACLITGITPQRALINGTLENDFFRLIHQELSTPGTCGVGYNSIRFDDEVTRYGLYRNFYDPYEREWKQGNSRWDIIDVVRLVYALRPDSLSWPLREDGSPSFKLELLSKANGIEHMSAHDALSDVHATIALAKLIKTKEPKLYEYCYQLRDKHSVLAHIDIDERKPFLHISSRFPTSNGCAALLAPLMRHPKNNNSIICYDLSVDPSSLLQLSTDEVIERLYVKASALPAGTERIPLKEVHLNKSPMVITAKMLDDQTAQRLNINKHQCELHWQQLCNADLKEKLTAVYENRSFASNTDAEQKLYDGFIGDSDRALLTDIRQASPESLSTFSEKLKDKRLITLLFRYRARYYPETLTESEQYQWQQWCYHRLTDETMGASLTLTQYFTEIDALKYNKGVDQNILASLMTYGDGLLN
jgi:exodeoxyribonuclease-1